MTRIFDHIMATDTLMHETFRGDLVFSNWVFVWFVLYWTGIIRQSPLLALLVGAAANTHEFLSTRKGKTIAWQMHYFIRNIFIKIVPISLILFSKNHSIHWKESLITVAVFYTTFLGWVHLNGASFSDAENPFNFNKKN